MWKLKIFSVAQILREINFRKARSSEIAAFCNSRRSEFCQFSKFQPSKSANIHKFRASKYVKNALLESLNLISRKI